jgi:molecular chaperone GrpE (heat shock protein)
MEGQNLLLTTAQNKTDSKISLAPEDAREGQPRELQDKCSREDAPDGKREPSQEGLAKHVWSVWHSALQDYRPDLRCSEFFGPAWNFARRVGEALGPDLETVVRAVVREWPEFRAYLFDVRGASKCSAEPDIAALAHHVDAAQNWLEVLEAREREAREEAEQERQSRERRAAEDAERQERDKASRRAQYRCLAATAESTQTNLAALAEDFEQHRSTWSGTEKEWQRFEADYEQYRDRLRWELTRLAELEAEFGPDALMPTDSGQMATADAVSDMDAAEAE